MKIHKLIVIILIVYIYPFHLSFGQNGSGKLCIEAEPLCGSSEFSYPNTPGINFAETGPNYGCVSFPLNPSWFYFQIAKDGDIQLRIEQSTIVGGIPDLDVDYVLYGPYNDPRLPCISDLTKANIKDCSYSPDFVEYVDIDNSLAGQYYLLIITNFSRKPGYITVNQTAGTATTNCNLLNNIIKLNEVSCKGDVLTLNATTIGAENYVWYEDDGFGTGNFNVINGAKSAILNVNKDSTFRAFAFNEDNVLLETYEFNTSFFQTPNISENISTYYICDTFGDNDGIAEFDLNIKNNEVLGNLDPSKFSVTYYSDRSSAHQGINPLPSIYTNSIASERIYVRVENILNSNLNCYDVQSFLIESNPIPEVIFEDTYILCVNTNNTEIITTPPIINTGLAMDDYTFVWSLNGVILPAENNNSIFALVAGDYKVEVTNRLTDCSNVFYTKVILSAPPVVSAQIISYAFIEENSIEVTATGIGAQDYEYRINNDLWQTENIFKNVSIGEHIITVRNRTGCGETTVNITFIDYPLYFTPNGDGINDTWQITGLYNQPRAKIHIFDRYGKLLKQLDPAAKGWDGTFKGRPVSTDDYWFTIEYIEPKDGSLKLFKAHFSLKR